MNRTQLKCFLASTGVHLLLGAVLLIGPAFLVTTHTPNDLPPLNLIPAKLVDDLVFNPGAAGRPAPPRTQLAPPLAAPAIAPAPVPVPPPEPKPAPVEPKPVVKTTPPVVEDTPKPPKTKPPEPDETAMDGEKAPPKAAKKPAVVADLTKKVVRGVDDFVEETKAAARARQAKERAQARAQATAAAENWQKEVSGALGSIRNGLSGGVTIEPVGNGIGGGTGEAYANYAQAIHSIYDRAWIDPAEVTDESLTVQTMVVIARDGQVISAKITQRSGNNALDKSVDNALKRVRKVPSFPEGAQENQRSYRIRFNLKAKRAIG
jgi:TonB family protein